MLLKQALLQAIVDGQVDLVFRRWKRPTVKPGGTLRTSLGVLAFAAVEIVPRARIRLADARRAGFASLAELLTTLSGREGDVYRIAVRFAGADPRIGLRQVRIGSATELGEVAARLTRLDRASRDGAWTARYLRLIAERPETRAVDLAADLGMEKKRFKMRVRRLKELGLTESLARGYRLSPRGRSMLQSLEQQSE